MGRGLVPVFALLTVGVLGAWFLAPHRPRPLPPARQAPASDDEPLAAGSQGGPPPPAPAPSAVAPPLPAAPAAEPPATMDHLPSPFARETVPHHLDAMRQATQLLKESKPNEAAQLLLDRANQSEGREADHLRAIAARIYVDLDRPEEARAILRSGPADRALQGEYKALDARLNKKRYLPPRMN